MTLQSVSARNESHSRRAIQTSINKLEEWTKTKGMKFSSEKTVAIKFEKRKTGDEPQLTLHNNVIQTKDSTRYLGLVIDKRLSWKHHVEHLRAKCIPAINLLKHLSHLSWGADRKTLKHLYTALVKSKLDYGAHIYGTPGSKALHRLDPIQNECLRACTGAFKSSPAVSLYTDTGIPPLKYSRDVISLKYFFKTLAHPGSLTHTVTMGDNPPPSMEHTQSLLAKYRLSIPKIWQISTPEKPPWLHPLPKICPFIESKKINRNEEEMRTEFLSHLELHPTKHVYTDGSKTEQYVGYAAKIQG